MTEKDLPTATGDHPQNQAGSVAGEHHSSPAQRADVKPRDLMFSRRFAPFFMTQFLGAFNDNVFKNALIILITYGIAEAASTNALVNIAAGLFILPFFLFSALAGQLADRFDKARYMRHIKVAEIVIMAVGATGLVLGSLPLLLFVLFLMGAQSTFFGPAKYAILPQHLATRELTAGNALVESGTFLAILLGTIVGGLLAGMGTVGTTLVAIAVIVVAIAGYLASRSIPAAPPTGHGHRINYNLATETLALLRLLGADRSVFLSVLGISWFWFLGAVYLTQFPNFTRVVLGGDATVATLLLAVFSIGIGGGSFICEKLSRGRIEAGLVPIGIIGMTVFGIHLGLVEPMTNDSPVDAIMFITNPTNLRVVIDLLLLSMFGGLYIVPLYTLVQHLSKPAERARIIAANNVLNALFMVLASIVAIAVLGAGRSIAELFLIISITNIGVSIYIFGKAPEFLFKMLGWLLVHSLYRVRKQGLANIPTEGPAILAANHVSFVDAVIMHAICPRQLRFVMDADIYNIPVLNWLFRSVGAIPVTDPRINRHLVRQGYDLIANALDRGELVCIFPEGGITRDGEIQKFKNGIDKIVKRTPVPVIPVALQGLWGSFFSYASGMAMRGLPRKLFARITIIVGAAIAPQSVSTQHLHQVISSLRGTQR
ncbi:MAG: MFS transporter [marine bacterium B5-7]|nr:MAG: MFS transporter [marine bacterium B5-7]